LSWGPVRVEIRHPPPGFPDRASSAGINDNSFVIRISYGQVSLLFPGDIGPGVERRLARARMAGTAQFMVGVHHGSRRSNTSAFLDKYRPEVIVFSVGFMNRYRHPHRAVRARAVAAGARVFRTDRHGAVTFITDGRIWSVRTFR